MADPRDDRVSSTYREMPNDGPPAALDAAIQAAARRAVGARPGGARRWQIPVSIAAVLALAVGVSLQVDREKPLVVDGTPVSSGSAEYPVPQAAPEKEERTAPATPSAAPAAAVEVPRAKEVSPSPEAQRLLAKEPQAAPEAKRFAPDPPRAELPAPAAPAVEKSLPAATMASPLPAPAAVQVAPANVASPPAAAGAAAPASAMRAAPQAVLRAKSEMTRDAALQEMRMTDALEPPEKRLERIAELRTKGQHDEADRALAEFRRAYPGYRISEEWLRKVER